MLDELLAARDQRIPCALVTVAATRGSVPREAGAKMIVYTDGKTSGTIGGGKFESLVIDDARSAMHEKKSLLKTYPLHEGDVCSFGAICGGEVTILIEPQNIGDALILVGAGHCSRAIAKLGRECGFHVTVIDDRANELDQIPDAHNKITQPPADVISTHNWQPDEALVIVSRNYVIDQAAVFAALRQPAIRYVGMIGSRKKVRHVFDELKKQGVTDDQLARVYAPIGLDIGADSPSEIAVSVIAEILQVLRGHSGAHLRMLNNACSATAAR